MITFSMSHLFFSFFFFLIAYPFRWTYRKFLIVIILILSIYFLIDYLAIYNSTLYSLKILLSRFGLFEKTIGATTGFIDNRYIFLDKSIESLADNSVQEFLFGVTTDQVGCCNPLWPIVIGGLLGSFYYYSFLLLLVVSMLFTNIRNGFFLLLILLLLLQRPELGFPGVTFLLVLIMTTFYGSTFPRAQKILG